MREEVSHKDIYDRLVAVESKVDHLDSKTDDVVKAFEAAKGAFTVLDWIAKAVKPFLWIAGGITLLIAIWEKYKP